MGNEIRIVGNNLQVAKPWQFKIVQPNPSPIPSEAKIYKFPPVRNNFSIFTRLRSFSSRNLIWYLIQSFACQPNPFEDAHVTLNRMRDEETAWMLAPQNTRNNESENFNELENWKIKLDIIYRNHPHNIITRTFSSVEEFSEPNEQNIYISLKLFQESYSIEATTIELVLKAAELEIENNFPIPKIKTFNEKPLHEIAESITQKFTNIDASHEEIYRILKIAYADIPDNSLRSIAGFAASMFQSSIVVKSSGFVAQQLNQESSPSKREIEKKKKHNFKTPWDPELAIYEVPEIHSKPRDGYNLSDLEVYIHIRESKRLYEALHKINQPIPTLFQQINSAPHDSPLAQMKFLTQSRRLREFTEDMAAFSLDIHDGNYELAARDLKIHSVYIKSYINETSVTTPLGRYKTNITLEPETKPQDEIVLREYHNPRSGYKYSDSKIVKIFRRSSNTYEALKTLNIPVNSLLTQIQTSPEDSLIRKLEYLTSDQRINKETEQLVAYAIEYNNESHELAARDLKLNFVYIEHYIRNSRNPIVKRHDIYSARIPTDLPMIENIEIAEEFLESPNEYPGSLSDAEIYEEMAGTDHLYESLHNLNIPLGELLTRIRNSNTQSPLYRLRFLIAKKKNIMVTEHLIAYSLDRNNSDEFKTAREIGIKPERIKNVVRYSSESEIFESHYFKLGIGSRSRVSKPTSIWSDWK